MFVCQTPYDKCAGKTVLTNNGLRGSKIKVHATGVEANRCYGNHLVNNLGYERVLFNNREFSKGDEPHLTLPKRRKPDFRSGKSGKEGGKTNSRYQPNKRGGRSGVIIG